MTDLRELQARLATAADVDEELAIAAELRALPPAAFEHCARGRLAVLTGYTSKWLTELTFAHAVARGVHLETRETLYGLYEQALFARDPELVAFRPNVVYFCVGSEHLALESVASEVERWRRAWELARELFECDVILNTFVEPAPRVYGNAELKLEGSRGRAVAELNLALASAAPPYVHLHDVNALALEHGRAKLFDQKWFTLAKLPASMACLPDYARSLAAVVGALHGRSKKGVVLDLDGTLWGGVVGDDGIDGIRVGGDTAEGESFSRFQRYLKALAERGVFLAVVSKNEEAVARAAFERREMPLRLADFSAFAASWGTKDKALLEVARTLNVLPESLVFVDDSPAERELMRQRLPEVTVVELPTDPTLYPAALAAGRYFETVSVTKEDRLRAKGRDAELARAELERDAGSYEDYLASLQMEASIRPWNEEEVPRVVQLVGKTNQFNLTGLRFTDAQMRARIGDPAFLSLCLSLRDRFGDHGLVSVLAGHARDGVCELENWVMSCRVFKRGVEAVMFGEACRTLHARGVRSVVGKLVVTERNGYVKDLFPSLGFEPTGTDESGATTWRFELDAQSAAPPKSPILVNGKAA
ncbi:MAG TPA: HAD-IIIC family phosphatase [Polyangiaceae bacterium]|nr:HAD-IIIC family phosphatase [Polyangiaceae bacterium]